MTDILDRLAAAIEEADAGTDALCAEYFATAMESVRDLLDGSNGGYVAPQNRGARADFDPTPPSARGGIIRINISPAMVETCREFNQSIGRAMQQMAANLQRARTTTQDDFEEQA